MLFNSYIFVLLFLPLTLVIYYSLLGRKQYSFSIAWLVAASLFFYGWWNPVYLYLILLSVLFNYGTGVSLTVLKRAKPGWAFTVLCIGVAANLAALGFFKYANFFVDNFNLLFRSSIYLHTILLPLGISFFTFQQIAYLVDTYRGETKEYNFLHYCLFVTFFPQLIAGPIVHHKEMLPQFSRRNRYRPSNLSIGLTIFIMGLAKKVILADTLAQYATPVFHAASLGKPLTLFEAWGGVMAYTFQLYFDFSGYSDMAIGIGRMFGIRLPLNFHSPYKSENIIIFWRRWHMTLSRFLKDYLYIPLGGNRKGKVRRYVNMMITMVLGGFWHGANWTFVVWGSIHGACLVLNHLWRTLRGAPKNQRPVTIVGRYAGRLTTFLVVIIGWVFFRAESFHSALAILKGMSGGNGVYLPLTYEGDLNRFFGLGSLLNQSGIHFRPLPYFKNIEEFITIGIALMICWAMPNTQQIMERYRPAYKVYDHEPGKAFFRWRPTYRWVMVTGMLACWAIILMNRVSEFLYFQF